MTCVCIYASSLLIKGKAGDRSGFVGTVGGKSVQIGMCACIMYVCMYMYSWCITWVLEASVSDNI